MGRIEYRKGLTHIFAETDAFRWRYIRPIFNTEVKSDKLLAVLMLVSLVVSASCEGVNDESDLHPLSVGEHTFYVEIAETPEDRARGLMHRDSLPDDHGMLFVFDRDQQLSFWMKDTSIPLSIAYIARDGTIREIHDMEPFSLEPVRSTRSVRYALEVNRGAFEAAGIHVGDRVDVSDF